MEIVFNASEYKESTEDVQDMNDSELDDDVVFKDDVFRGEENGGSGASFFCSFSGLD